MDTLTTTMDPQQMMLVGCGHTVVSHNLKWEWECTQELCDGEHHFMQIQPWEFHR